MVLILPALFGCGPTSATLASPDPRVQERAVRSLPAWRARRMVPLLEKWAVLSRDTRPKLSEAAMVALVRTDLPEALQVVERQARCAEGRAAVAALGSARTKRSCELLAELCLLEGPWQGTPEACRPLSSSDLADGWPCYRSLDPYRSQFPTAEELWQRASRYSSR